MANGWLICDSERLRPHFNSMKSIFSYLNISEIRACLPAKGVIQGFTGTVSPILSGCK